MKNLVLLLLSLIPCTAFGATLEEVNAKISSVDADFSEIYTLDFSFTEMTDDFTSAIDSLGTRNVPFNNTDVNNDIAAAENIMVDVFDYGETLSTKVDYVAYKLSAAIVYRDAAAYDDAMTALNQAETAIGEARSAYWSGYNKCNSGSSQYGSITVSYANSVQYQIDHADNILDALEQ